MYYSLFEVIKMGIHPFIDIIYGWEVEKYDLVERFIRGEISHEAALIQYLRMSEFSPVGTYNELEEYLEGEPDIYSDFHDFLFEMEEIWNINFATGGEYNYDYVAIGKTINIHSDPEQFKRSIDSAVYGLSQLWFPFTKEFMEELGEPKVIGVLGMG